MPGHAYNLILIPLHGEKSILFMFNFRSFFIIKIKTEKSSPVTSFIKYSSCGTNIYCIMSIAESLLGIYFV